MLVNMQVKEFIEETSSDSPAPGGGSVSSMAGAMGAALAIMVCNLTLKNKNYSEYNKDIESIKKRASRYQKRLMELIDLDTNAFNFLMNAYKLPSKNDEEKEVRLKAIQVATAGAANIPLQVIETCLGILRLLPELALKGNENAISDVGVAAKMAISGLEGAALNVFINLNGIKDKNKCKDLEIRTNECIEQGNIYLKEIINCVNEKILKK